MGPLPVEVYSAASVRAMDRRAIAGGIPGYVLMQRAGEAAFATLRRHWPGARSVGVLCGPGNNAGDGYVVARLARAAGLDVRVIAVSDPRGLQGDAARAQVDFAADGGHTESSGSALLERHDVFVDALLGTGTDRPLEEPFASVVRQLNQRGAPVLALDIPSGLDADSGEPHGQAVIATVTLAFVALKSGYYLGMAPDYVGRLEFAGLELPPGIRAAEQPVMRRIDGPLAARALPPRRRSAHKGAHGRVVIVGGHAMPGAARLAGEAALRTGAGLVSIVTSAASAAAILAGRPELIVRSDLRPEDLESGGELRALALGPGLGLDAGAERTFEAALATRDRLVVDADALTLLAARPRKAAHWILTPHPGEARRLLDSSATAVPRSRLDTVREIVDRYGGTCVLKGANTLVHGGTSVPWVCDRGNPGMATAGSGDVLTGVIAALLACADGLVEAAAAGVFLHAEAGDRAARAGMRGMIASDILAELRGVVNHPWN
ncbi:MAG: NAD(P)H-hydrate dehydratase [Gammaproteobacteria bacterium]|nr:NAD(P)H-hydrate dehydratase [Gammaproteobacteria bacterium]